jgi:hypothetical protein
MVDGSDSCGANDVTVGARHFDADGDGAYGII